MNYDKSLTILLTLKGRPQFTLRWMFYANSIRFPFRVLIADGGADEIVPEVLSNRANFPNVDYKYIRYPYDQTYADYYAKVADALSQIETPFVVMADNDDFFVVSGLMQSVEFLQQHSEYSSCRGVIGAVIVEPTPHLGELSQVYGTEILFAAHLYPQGPINDTTALQRIRNYFSCYRPTWYDVCRTEQAVKKWRVFKELNIKDMLVAEYIPQLIGIASGKVHIDSYLYLIRQVKGPGSASENEQHQKGDHFDRMFLETWSGDVKGLVDSVAEVVAQEDRIPVDDARQQVRKGYQDFIAGAVLSCLLQKTQPPGPIGICYRIISRLRMPAHFVRNVISGRPLVRPYIPGRHFVRSHSDFKPIYDFLTTPPPTGEGQGVHPV